MLRRLPGRTTSFSQSRPEPLMVGDCKTTKNRVLTLTGVSRTMLLINGQYPGPLIRLNRGDRLLVNVTNQMSNATTVHWHGLFQNGTNWMDGTSGITQCPIPAGSSFLYNFTVENQFGTYWYVNREL